MNTTTTLPFWTEEDIISRYTRADALNDGELIAAPGELTRQAGISVPVALTRAAWYQYIEPSYLPEMPDQELTGRLWDLLWMLRMAAAKSRSSSVIIFRVRFELLQKRARATGIIHHRSGETVELKAICGPGDDIEPVITVMLPAED
jgi:hypothetical protein